MTREEIQSVIVGLEQAGEGESVASRKLCRDAVALLRWMDERTGDVAAMPVESIFADLDRERKAVSS